MTLDTALAIMATGPAYIEPSLYREAHQLLKG